MFLWQVGFLEGLHIKIKESCGCIFLWMPSSNVAKQNVQIIPYSLTSIPTLLGTLTWWTTWGWCWDCTRSVLKATWLSMITTVCIYVCIVCMRARTSIHANVLSLRWNTTTPAPKCLCAYWPRRQTQFVKGTIQKRSQKLGHERLLAAYCRFYVWGLRSELWLG